MICLSKLIRIVGGLRRCEITWSWERLLSKTRLCQDLHVQQNGIGAVTETSRPDSLEVPITGPSEFLVIESWF